jgi:hypothetical protein
MVRAETAIAASLSLSFRVFGLGVQVRSPLADFAEFLRRNYSSFACEALPAAADVQIAYGPEGGRQAEAAKADMAAAGMGVYVGDRRLYWENEFGFRVLVTAAPAGRLGVRAYHFDLERPQDVETRFRNFQRSMRWAVHFPVFLLLRQRRGWQLLHASAVERGGAALVFCGLNKVGKSTLAMHLCRQRGYRLLTDNFLLLDREYVYGFPEMLRVSPEALALLGLARPDNPMVYGKYQVPLDRLPHSLSARPQACFFLTRGRELRLSPLASEVGWQTMRAAHGYLGEFPEQSFLTLLPLATGELPDDVPPPAVADRSVSWFHLSFPHDWNLSQISEEIERCT